jgi:hypothetical protein
MKLSLNLIHSKRFSLQIFAFQSLVLSPQAFPVLLGFLLTVVLIFLERLIALGVMQKLPLTKIKLNFSLLLKDGDLDKAQKLCRKYQKRGPIDSLERLLIFAEEGSLNSALFSSELLSYQARLEKRISGIGFLGLISLIMGALMSLISFLKLQHYQVVTKEVWNWYLTHKLSVSLYPLLLSLGVCLICLSLEWVLVHLSEKRFHEGKQLFYVFESFLLFDGGSSVTVKKKKSQSIETFSNDETSNDLNDLGDQIDDEILDEEEII